LFRITFLRLRSPEKNPAAIILSGGPSSVYEENSPRLDAKILELGIPVLGICYGFQVLAQALGGRVDKTGKREYGATDLKLSSGGTLLASQP
jgi:GMP synthase (glutamine-hydrolysing)